MILDSRKVRDRIALSGRTRSPDRPSRRHRCAMSVSLSRCSPARRVGLSRRRSDATTVTIEASCSIWCRSAAASAGALRSTADKARSISTDSSRAKSPCMPTASAGLAVIDFRLPLARPLIEFLRDTAAEGSSMFTSLGSGGRRDGDCLASHRMKTSCARCDALPSRPTGRRLWPRVGVPPPRCRWARHSPGSWHRPAR